VPTFFWLTRCGTLDYLTDTLPEARVIDGRDIAGLQEPSESSTCSESDTQQSLTASFKGNDVLA
jgi:hypothetical protein